MCLGLALALSLFSGSAVAEPRLEFLTHFVYDKGPREFGGLSGLLMSDNGTRAQVLTDRGKLFEIQLERNSSHKIIKVELMVLRYLKQRNEDFLLDTEGLARAADGGVYVSLEQPERVMMYPAQENDPIPLAPFPDLGIRNDNRGLEALATNAAGALFVLPETPPDIALGHPVFQLKPEGWELVRHVQTGPGFLAVGADFGPDGRLYILERAVSLLGFRSRIWRVSVTDTATPPELIWQTRVNEFDNLEGIDVWNDSADQTRITLVSDNNFLNVQRTELLEFLLKE